MKPPVRRSLLVSLSVASVAALAASSQAFAVLPLPTYPQCGEGDSLAQCPPDMTRSDGSWKGSTWEFVSFIPDTLKHKVRPEELELGAGNGFDRAYRTSTGRFDVTIAVLDSGILWQEWELANKVRINAGELPRPQTSGGAACAADDCNGDGIFNVRDFANDPRVRPDLGIDAADGLLEGSDLIAAFSDGKDDDGNGYVDDIAGWDFLWDDNQPYPTNGFDHGSGVMSDTTAEGGDADTDLGYCPNCSVLPIRTGDSFMADADRLAQGILYATDLGVKVIAMASGTINNTALLHEALRYAWEHGVLVVSAIGDELSYHHLYPGAADYLMAVHSIRYWPPIDWDDAVTFLQFNGCNNFGSHLTVVAGTTACATGATAITSGTAGLLFSRGRDLGLELHPDEVRAMLVESATDINVPGSTTATPWFPSRPGWDLFFGYGRVNAGRALELGVPPQVHLTGPRWYEFIDAADTATIDIAAHLAAPRGSFYDWKLEWAPGGNAADRDFMPLTQGTGSSPFDGVIYAWPVAAIPREMLDPAQPLEQVFTDHDVLTKFDMANTHAITVKLTATDDRGRKAEMRKTFFLHDDPDQLSGFPRRLGASGQASPLLFDVDGDGNNDLLIGTASGMVHIFDGLTGGELPGWPIQMPVARGVDPANPANHLQARAYASGKVAPPRQGVLASVVAGDLEDDGEVEVVVSTMDGKTWVYSSRGQVRAGFPVSRGPVSDADTGERTWMDPGILSTPYLADLDGDGYKEIIQAAMDQHVYVWRRDGAMQPGWPVKLESSGSEENIKGRIVSSPEVADFNGDGVLDIVIGANEYNPELYVPGFAYVLSGLGKADREGPILRGWPAVVPGALNGVVPFIGEGVTMTPIVADVDGDGRPEVALSGTVSCPHLYEHDGRRSTQMGCASPRWTDPATQDQVAVSFISNPIFADLDQDGDLEIVATLSGASYAIVLGASTWLDYQDHLVGAWDAQTGEMLEGWPVVIDDLALFIRPEAADVDGDGFPEVLVSSGGYVIHALDLNGIDVPGWPKLTGGMVSSAIEAGDFDGDGRNEVIAMTHEGYLFAWGTEGLPQGHAHPPLAYASMAADSSRTPALPAHDAAVAPASSSPRAPAATSPRDRAGLKDERSSSPLSPATSGRIMGLLDRPDRGR